MAGTQYNATRHDAAAAGAAGSAMMRSVTLTCMAMAGRAGRWMQRGGDGAAWSLAWSSPCPTRRRSLAKAQLFFLILASQTNFLPEWDRNPSYTNQPRAPPLSPFLTLGSFLSYTCNDASMHASSASLSRPLTLHRQHLVFLILWSTCPCPLGRHRHWHEVHQAN
jgi:hypothetical protein